MSLEKRLREKCEALGCLCEKFVSPGRRGAPDRLITPPGLPMELVEMKRPTGVLGAHQRRDHLRRRLLGVRVSVLYTAQEVDDYVLDLMRRIREARGVTYH